MPGGVFANLQQCVDCRLQEVEDAIVDGVFSLLEGSQDDLQPCGRGSGAMIGDVRLSMEVGAESEECESKFGEELGGRARSPQRPHFWNNAKTLAPTLSERCTEKKATRVQILQSPNRTIIQKQLHGIAEEAWWISE